MDLENNLNLLNTDSLCGQTENANRQSPDFLKERNVLGSPNKAANTRNLPTITEDAPKTLKTSDAEEVNEVEAIGKVESTVRVQRKRIALIDSEDDDDTRTPSDIENALIDRGDDDPAGAIEKFRLIESDSDEENDDTEDAPKTLNTSDAEEVNEVEAIGNVESTVRVQRKRIALIDSEDEDEPRTPSDIEKPPTDRGDDDPAGAIEKFRLIESDSDEENDDSAAKKVKTKIKRTALIDSDSEDEEGAAQKTEEPVIYTFDKKGELLAEDSLRKHTINLSNLCDPESSDEHDVVSQEENEDKIEPIRYKKKTKKTAEDGPKKMSSKEAMEQRKEIASESQRMLRESRVSLPYHRPKQRTLREFLQKRPKFASALPMDTKKQPVSVAIKMSSRQLDVIVKNIAEREKQVEEFFKSESDESEDESDVETPVENLKSIERNELLDHATTLPVENVVSAEINASATAEDEAVNLEAAAADAEDSVANVDDPAVDVGASVDTAVENVELEVAANTNIEANTADVEAITANVETANVDVEAASFVEDMEVDCDNITENSTTLSHTADVRLDLQQEEEEDNRNLQDPTGTNQDSTTADSQDAEVEQEQHQNTEKNVDCDESKGSSLISKMIKEKLGNTVPKLSGGPNLVIDLEEGTTKPNEVAQLMERFIHHTCKKKQQKSNIELSVVSVSGSGKIHEEKVAVKVNEDEEPEIIEKPGVKLQKLRNELQQRMAEQRSKLWQQRLEGTKINADNENSIYEGETSKCKTVEDDLLDCDEEEELTDPESSSEDEEEEEDYEVRESKSKGTSEFLEMEADEDEDAEEPDWEEDEESVADATEQGDEEQLEKCEDENVSPKKPLKRILKPFDDDSDDEDDVQQNIESYAKAVVERDLDSTGSWEDDFLQPAQLTKGTPNRKRLETKSDIVPLTPVNHLTGLQSLNSGSKFLRDSPVSSSINLTSDPSPLKANVCQKKLFLEPDPISSQDDLSELEPLCSGVFPPTQNPEDITKCIYESQNDEFSTLEVLGICSGKFSGFTGKEAEINATTESNLRKQSPQKETIVLQTNHEPAEMASIDENDDRLISQLLDEEELKKFKKKFESPANQSYSEPKAVNSAFSVRINFDTDEEVDDDEEIVVTKNKKRNVIVDSDDDNTSVKEDEEISLHDDESAEDDNPREVEIGYDSEENEVEIEREAPRALKVKDFVENEAELSESEWGSEDEDEKGLDKLEIELGDLDEIDEKKMKRDLEKIHMRRVLDEDNRDIKYLQELLLENGELHGQGRQRQFRWKNVETENMGTDETKPEDEHFVYDDENDEAEWRKRRFEREVFLKKKMEATHLEDGHDITLDAKSQILKIGQKIVMNSTNVSVVEKKEEAVAEVKIPFALPSKRGSFLTRTDQVLSRVAEFTKVSDSVTLGGVAKKHYLFKTVDAEEANSEEKKRKATNAGTPQAIKKIRLTTTSPAVGKEKDNGSSKLKKLFANW